MVAVPAHLATLIDPMDVDDFLVRYWGKNRVVISGNDANRYSYLFTARDIDDLVYFGSWTIAAPDGAGPAEDVTVVRCIPSGTAGAGNRHLELQDVRTCYQRGKTILLQSVQARLPSVAALTRGLEQALECPVNVNMYLTPPGARGFPAHYDDHDVFICQLEGTKIWRFYESGPELPLRFDTRVFDDRLTAEPIGECRLCPGDLLYLPRGLVHEAFTDEQRSLHLSIGAHVFRWADLLGRAVASVSRKEVMLREALPPGWFGDHRTHSTMDGQFRQLLEMIADRALLDDSLLGLSIQFVDTLSEVADGSVAESFDSTRLDVETLMEKRPGSLCAVICGGDFATIYFPGGNLRGPSLIAEALDFVASVDRPFHVAELPSAMSAESKKVLVRRLAKEGLLRRVDAAPPASENALSECRTGE